MKICPYLCLSSIAILAGLLAAARGQEKEPYPDTPWQPLVVGGSMDGWKQLGGDAKYEIKDGIVTGTSVLNTPNSFLTTEKHYGDFVLEYGFKVDEQLNSGVQIRSHSLPEYQDGRVHGYQVEIDPDTERNRMWTAGIYDEARRGWLYDLKDNEPARKAFKPNQWNHIRVIAVGERIRTWLNGVPAADLTDTMTMTGFIGLQVHGIGGSKEKEGTKVQWRNLRIKDLGKHVWKPIFNGADFSGWRILPGGSWIIEEGGIIHGTSPESEARHGILLSEETFKDFAMRLKFKVEKGDSGFYFRANPVSSGVSVKGFQVEVDSSFETGGLYETGGRQWVVETDAEAMKSDKVYQPGEWTALDLSARGDDIHVFINGRRTARLLDDTKGRSEGHFGLQLHGGMEMDVYFRDLEILVPETGA